MGKALVPFQYRRGIFLPELDLWLDPGRRTPFAFVSHAHADHARRHDRVLATPATLDLMRVRRLVRDDATALRFGEEYELEGGRIELFPAGHVLGSAQIRVVTDSGSLVYTGDFKLRPGRSCEAPEVRRADVLIMETTFGIPRYRFPPAEEVVKEMTAFCRETLDAGALPVLMGYSLGKAQEILAALDGSGLPVSVHPSIERITRVYQEHGRGFPEWESMDPDSLEGKVLLIPPSARMPRLPANKAVRTGVVTGWGLDASARYRYRCDAVFPMSDHAGHDDLLRYVEQVRPRVVYTLHGYAEAFAQDLRSRGVEAWSLISPNQLEMPFARGDVN